MSEARGFTVIVLVGFITFWFNSCCCQWVTARHCLYVNWLFKRLSESPKLMSSVFMQLERISVFNTKGIFPGMQTRSGWKETGEGEKESLCS